MRRNALAAAAALLGTVLAALAPATSAPATEVRREVAPGVSFHAFTRQDPSAGRQEIRVLRFRADAPGLRFRPIAAADHDAALLPVSQLVTKSGAVAAVNGNFATPAGDVRGIEAIDGLLRSEPEVAINGALTPRVAWRLDGGTLVFGRPSSSSHLHRGDQQFALNGIERAPGYLNNPDEAVVQTRRVASTTSTPLGGLDVVLDGVSGLRADVAAPATVAEVRDVPGPIPATGAVVTATGANAADLRASGIAPGDEVELHVHVDDAGFASAQLAGGGGPWIVRDGGVVPRSEMFGEGFDEVHVDRRHPRTALGRAADGSILLVTVDGRQPGRSEGATLVQLAHIMIEQGAVEAISLDGGGSTAMSVDGLLMNVPSDQGADGRRVERPVAEALGVFLDFTPAVTRRLAGTDRIATAIEVSKERGSAQTVVVATSGGFADALVGSPLAAAKSAPVLLTAPAALDPRVADEIRRLGATEAYVLGGDAALSPQVAVDLYSLGLRVERLAGEDRYATAAAVSGALGPSPTVLVASGERFPDALAAGALGLPVVLTTRDALPAAAQQAIGSATPVVVGGSAAVAASVLPSARRVAGADRYATSAAVADWGIANGRYTDAQLVLARGDAYPDALVGGALRRPLLLVGRFSLAGAPATRDWLSSHGRPAQGALLLGGRQALSTMTHVEVESAVAPS